MYLWLSLLCAARVLGQNSDKEQPTGVLLSASLLFSMPPDYPAAAALQCHITSADLSRATVDSISQQLQQQAQEALVRTRVCHQHIRLLVVVVWLAESTVCLFGGLTSAVSKSQQTWVCIRLSLSVKHNRVTSACTMWLKHCSNTSTSYNSSRTHANSNNNSSNSISGSSRMKTAGASGGCYCGWTT